MDRELEKLYELDIWPMKPQDAEATKRFNSMKEVFSYLVSTHDYFKDILRNEKINVIDIAAGTGIAGAALANILSGMGKKVNLVATDIRFKDLDLVHEWLKGVNKVHVETIVCDAITLHKCFSSYKEEFHVALLWGYSTSHFNPWSLVRLFSSASHLIANNGVFIIEETDRVYGILYRVGYKDFLIEKETNDKLIVSIHLGYDIMKGSFKRGFYIIPGFKEIAKLEATFWNIATVAAIGWIFYNKVDIVTKMTKHDIHGSGYLIMYKEPRKSIDPETFNELPEIVYGK
ncbi:MAG: SAM-dependent methyltransferase [Thermoprotei archaeon]|nr:MAG: SAM-dependent methyltransferase [Thermoprotei archaeon]